jgi:hypothetical protein
LNISSCRYALALAALMAVYLLTWPFSLTNFDQARDIAVASSIAHGQSWPLEGPILASAIHAGPIWYYLFALPFVLAPSVLLAVMWVGVLAALKIPLAYLIGARFVDRPTGLLWALLLILPGWQTFEGITVLHPSLVALCTLAFLLFALNYARDGRPADLVAAGFALALAFHAHPSTFGLTFILVAAIVYRHRRAAAPWHAYLWLVLAFVAPFVPYVLSQAWTGFPDWNGAATYLRDPHNLGSLRNVPATFVGVFAHGPATVADGFADIANASPLLIGGYALIYIAGAVGLALSYARGKRQIPIAAMAAMFVVLFISVVAIRSETPYHLTYVIWVFASGLLALGLRAWFDFSWGRPIAVAAIAFAALWAVFIQASVAHSLERGTYAFSLLPLYDVKQPLQRGAPMPFLPMHALKASGSLLCAAPAVATHGALAVHLLHDYAIEARLACADASSIFIGGDATKHLAGVSRTIADALAIPVDPWLGPVGIAPVMRVVQPHVGTSVPPLTQYPPASEINDRASRYTIEFDAAADEVVLVTDIYFTFNATPAIEATVDGMPVAASARDQVSTAFICDRCEGNAPVRWRLDIITPTLDRVDVVTIARRGKH